MSLLKVLMFCTAIAAAMLAFVSYNLLQPIEIPQLKSEWWGPGKPRKVDESIRPFKINVPDEVLKDLQTRLNMATKFTPPLEGANFEYGFNSVYLREVLEFWKTKYNWREREKYLNQFPQFQTNVDGLDIHFLHVKPKNPSKNLKILPLILLHGWPGSIREFYEIIPLLTTPRNGFDFVFEVIAPSLPGYGFSEASSKKGLGPAHIAVIMKDLMLKLKHEKFYVQGGDWGAVIGDVMAQQFPNNVLGLHSNMCFINTLKSNFKRFVGSFWPALFMEESEVDKVYPFSEKFFTLMEEMGYMHIQATKPDTVGTALRDSPVGLAAYILEKFSTWTEPSFRSLPDGGLTKKYTLTDLLDNVMIYWVTGSITTSCRLYSETFNKAYFSMNFDKATIHVPTSCAMFPNELAYSPRSFLQEKYVNLVKHTQMKKGGHFAAFEEPKLLAEDIWESTQLFQRKNEK